MRSEYQTTETLNVKGRSRPMSIAETTRAIDDLEADDVLEVVTTDELRSPRYFSRSVVRDQ